MSATPLDSHSLARYPPSAYPVFPCSSSIIVIVPILGLNPIAYKDLKTHTGQLRERESFSVFFRGILANFNRFLLLSCLRHILITHHLGQSNIPGHQQQVQEASPNQARYLSPKFVVALIQWE
ncbi:hypothetical protein FRB93_010462 [Tulasnella sp. JGI-2019a]|nr:hypothetical protein FRB93_010462 [Tulasnella sp. JGI-2019a]